MDINSKAFSLIIGLLSFIAWGALPIYWAQFTNVDYFEVISYRAVFSMIFTGIIVLVMKNTNQVLEVFRSKKLTIYFILSTIFILANWSLFIYAVMTNRITQSSMGYYINPLLNVLASAIIFKSKVNRVQMLSVLLVIMGVMNLLLNYGSFPIIALLLASTFCLYAIIHKKVTVKPLPGLLVEGFFMSIPAVIYIAYTLILGKGIFFTGTTYEITLLLLSGVVTSLPLAGFAFAVQRLNLSTVGLMQYIAPTLSFLIGVFIYKEVFTKTHLISFIFIWTAVIIYSLDSLIRYEYQKYKLNKKFKKPIDS